MVVNGAYRGLRAILEGLNTAKFCVSVRIDQVCTYIHTYIHTCWISLSNRHV